MNHIYGVNKFKYARYCTETDIFLKLPELDPDLVVKFMDPDPTGSGSGSATLVERLHRHLKDALHASTAAVTWSEELPFVLLSLHAQPREDTGLSPLRQFGLQLSCPMNFF